MYLIAAQYRVLAMCFGVAPQQSMSQKANLMYMPNSPVRAVLQEDLSTPEFKKKVGIVRCYHYCKLSTRSHRPTLKNFTSRILLLVVKPSLRKILDIPITTFQIRIMLQHQRNLMNTSEKSTIYSRRGISTSINHTPQEGLRWKPYLTA